MSIFRRRRTDTTLTPEQEEVARRYDEITMHITGQTPFDLALERACIGEKPMPWDAEHLKNIGGAIIPDPGYVGPNYYPPRTAEEEAQLPELARQAHESRVAFDALKGKIE